MQHERVSMSRRANAKENLRGRLTLLLYGVVVAITIASETSISQASAPPSGRTAISVPEDAVTFELKEISAFDLPERIRTRSSIIATLLVSIMHLPTLPHFLSNTAILNWKGKAVVMPLMISMKGFFRWRWNFKRYEVLIFG